MNERLFGSGGSDCSGVIARFASARAADCYPKRRTNTPGDGATSAKLVLAPRRGEIIDRNGEPLALSFPTESLFVRTKQLPLMLPNKR